MINPETFTAPEFTSFDEMAKRANESYKNSRAQIGVNDLKAKFLAETSAWYGEQAYRIAAEERVEPFIANVVAKDAVIAYYNAGLFSDVNRFGLFLQTKADPLLDKAIAPYFQAARVVLDREQGIILSSNTRATSLLKPL